MIQNFQGLKLCKLAPGCFNLGALRKLSFDFTINEHFPDIDKLRTKYLYLKMVEDAYKNLVCNELIEECNIDRSAFYLQGFERKHIITVDIEILKKHGLLKSSSSEMSIINGLLGYLEPFPLDNRCMSVFKSQLSPGCVTLKSIRDWLEKQYLAWKFNVDPQQITEILFRFQYSFYTCRSLRNLRRNCSILDMIPSFRNESLSKKIYLINQQPFNTDLVLNFNKCLHCLNWDVFSLSGRRTLQCSFSQLYFFIQILQNKGFTSKQIQESIPFLYVNFDTFINRMNVMLSHPALAQHRQHEKFLQLLVYPAVYFTTLNITDFRSFEWVRDAVNMIHSKMKLKSRSERITIASLKYHTSDYFAIDGEHLNILKRHPKYTFVTEKQLSSTLKFLKTSGFSAAEILESIFIILYPRRAIVNALEKVAEEAEALSEMGLVKGCVSEQTNFFKSGTKLKQKTLQLCLYYIEKQFNFSWDGVLNLNVKE